MNRIRRMRVETADHVLFSDKFPTQCGQIDMRDGVMGQAIKQETPGIPPQAWMKHDHVWPEIYTWGPLKTRDFL